VFGGDLAIKSRLTYDPSIVVGILQQVELRGHPLHKRLETSLKFWRSVTVDNNLRIRCEVSQRDSVRGWEKLQEEDI